MAKETLEQLIEKTRKKYQDDNNNRIAFLGKVSSGKTIVAALLKHTLSKSWIPKTNGKWEAVTIRGQDEINDIIRNMKKGKFTAATLKENYPELVVGVYSMEGIPRKYELVLHDMSGENYSDYLTSSSYENIEDRLRDILSNGGDYLPFAKKYVIMIDCDDDEEWETDIAKVGPMISKIREIKQKIHNHDENEKIHDSIAIMFTKADLLSEEDQAKTAKELAKKYPELISSLRINHDEKELEFFKVSVATTMETDEEANTRVRRRDEQIKEEHEERITTWNKQTKTVIEGKITALKIQAENEGQTCEEIKEKIETCKSEAEAEYKQQFDKAYQIPENEEESGKKSKIVNPLTYSESEYNKFISWILNVKNES